MAAGGGQFVREMEAFIAAKSLLSAGETVLVAVSGGADSVALAAALRAAGRYDLHLGHVHHGLRPDADGDADFVAELASRWRLPVGIARIDTPLLAARFGAGIEEAARRGRYDALTDLARSAGAGAVAVAHHADDQVETVLHRIVRGTHLRGAAGMAPRRPLAEGIALVRPLLWARRDAVEAFCRDQHLTWRTDPTNAETDFTRNFIRHDLLPLLRERLNARVDEALLRLSAAAGEADAVLGALAEALFERSCRKRSAAEVVLRVAPLAKAPPALAAMAMRRALAALGAPQQAMSAERFDDLLALLAGQAAGVDLPGGVRAERGRDAVRLSRSARRDADG